MSNGFRFGPWSSPSDHPVRDAAIGISWGLWLIALLAVLGALILFAPLVMAQDHASDGATPRRLSRQTVILAFEVARVAMNESMGYDLALIWQTVEGRAPGTPGRRHWLRMHSRCVSGLLTEAAVQRRPGPCAWTRELTPRGDQPPSWPGSSAQWARVQRRWREVLRRSMEHVGGDRLPLVCPVDPRTWDQRAGLESARARGWRDLDCKGTRNVGFVRRQSDGS